MRVLRKTELKGILGMFSFAFLLGVIMLGLTGTLTQWFGWRLPWQKSISDKIVFVSDRNGHPDIWTMNPDGSDQKPLTDDEFPDSDPVVSPDGYTIVFVSSRSQEGSQIYSMDADGSHLHRISRITGSKSRPAFSHDGRELTFLCGGGLWRIGSDGSYPERVLPTPQETAIERMNATKNYYTWAKQSFDGKLLAGIRSSEDKQEVVWLSRHDDVPKLLSPTTDRGTLPITEERVFGEWNDSEAKLALSMTDPEGTGLLLVVDIESNSIPMLYSGNAMIDPIWSPDGGKIAAVEIERRNASDYIPVKLMELDLTRRETRVIDKGGITGVQWSPDGGSIVYSKNGDIYSADIETGKVSNLTNGKGVNKSPRWTPSAK